MILSIGEILADMIGERDGENLIFKTFCGGAPFNVAVNAKQSGASVAFIGKVGKDNVGKFLIDYASKAELDHLNIAVDKKRNTTLAFVTLTDGERDFTFFRNNTADFNLDIKDIDFSLYKDLNIVHLGSLMLSEKVGEKFAHALCKKVKKAKKLLSFDLNLRMDLYENEEDAVKVYAPFIKMADILKFSEEEILWFTGKDSFEDAICSLYKQDRILLISLGSKGSMYYYNGMSGVVPTTEVKPVDTTGAGDAFFGGFLAKIDGKIIDEQVIKDALVFANECGAKATQFKGAIKI